MSSEQGMSRRDFLTGVLRPREVGLACTGAMVWSWSLQNAAGSELALRPPGALDRAGFLATCIRCGECVEACPFGTLRLGTPADEHAIGTPHFEPRRIPCYMCEDTPCIAVCPTDALQKDTPIEEARMGLAVLLDQENCLAFLGLRCEVCYRACPLIGKAIRLEFRRQERTGKHAFFLPVVDSEACTGCGMCERSCVLEESAIRVLPHALAQGRPGEGYRLGWTEEPEISREFIAPDAPPDLPQWEGALERALERLDDTKGLEEP
jgi:ferredoxin-type protein NapG